MTIPEDGEYKITIEASCTEAQKEFAKFKLSVGDVVVAKEHACTAEDSKKYEFTAKLKKGKHPWRLSSSTTSSRKASTTGTCSSTR